MTGIAPGAYVRAVSGMYRGAEGCVVRIDVSASGSYAVVDVGEAQPIAVYVSALELVGSEPTTARGAARARRPLDGADAQALEGALTMTEQERDDAIAERDRLRRELEALRAHVDERARQHEQMFRYDAESALHDVSARLDAILRGEP